MSLTLLFNEKMRIVCDPRSYEASKAVAKKAQNSVVLGSNPVEAAPLIFSTAKLCVERVGERH